MTRPIEDYIRTIPDFPKPGIQFRDITTLLADPQGLALAVDKLTAPFAGARLDRIAALDARGFILGGAIACRLSLGLVTIRKAGKLPGPVIGEDYTLEYGDARMEIHDDALEPGERVLLIDDLLATGGTAAAGIRLIERLGAQVAGSAFVIDLPDLGGRARLEAMGQEVHTLCAFAGD